MNNALCKLCKLAKKPRRFAHYEQSKVNIKTGIVTIQDASRQNVYQDAG